MSDPNMRDLVVVVDRGVKAIEGLTAVVQRCVSELASIDRKLISLRGGEDAGGVEDPELPVS